MRLYEIVYIFDANLTEDSVSAKLDGYHQLLTGDAGGEVTAIDHWGSRQLAYPIQKQKSGYYVIVHARAAVESLPEFERRLTLDEELMRYLIVVNEGEPTDGKSIVLERPPRAHDDDDDDEVRGGGRDVPRPEPEAAAGAPATESSDSEEGPVAVVVRRGPPEFSGGMGRRRRMEGPPVELLNYKDVAMLSRFMTEQGKILPKRTTKVTARLQRQLGQAIKRARYLALVPYVRDHEA